MLLLVFYCSYNGDSLPGVPSQLTASGSVDARKQRIDPNSSSPPGPFGRPGGGAPLRTSSGRVMATVEGDPDTRFQKHLSREVENSLVSGTDLSLKPLFL